MASGSFLDDLFEWAAVEHNNPEHRGYTQHVNARLAAVSSQGGNVVAYAEGTLFYYPAHFLQGAALPAYFDGYMTEYFSNRRYYDGQVDRPFDASLSALASFDLTITAPLLIDPSAGYSIEWRSSGRRHDFVARSEVDVVYGTIDNQWFVTIALCDAQSVSPDTGPK